MTDPTFSTILVATDLSSGSDRAFEVALTVAGKLGARIELVHVIDPALQDFPFGIPYPDAAGALADRGTVERALAERVARARAAGVPCEVRVLAGAAEIEIVRRATAIRADLVVVGTHGRTGLAHVMMGSIAERVVQHAGRPVLSVPLEGQAA